MTQQQQLPYDKIMEEIDRSTIKLQDALERIKVDKNFKVVIFNADEQTRLYTYVYNLLCSQPQKDYGHQLYEKFNSIHCEYLRKKILPNLQQKSGSQFLEELTDRWDLYLIFVRSQVKTFQYLNRSHVQIHGSPTIESLAMNSFQNIINDRFQKQIVDYTIQEFVKDRKNQECQRLIIKRISDMISTLFVGRSENDSQVAKGLANKLSQSLIEESNKHYSFLFSSWSQSLSCQDYLAQVDKFISEEQVRIQDCFSSSADINQTHQNLMNQIFIENYSSILLESEFGLNTILKNDKFDVLGQIYKLYSRLPKDCLDFVRRKFREHIAFVVKEIIEAKVKTLSGNPGQDLQNDPAFIERLYDCHQKFVDVIKTHLDSNNLFLINLREAYQLSMNLNIGDYGVAEYLAIYADKLLSKDGKQIHSQEVNQLEVVVTLFQHIYDKDLFITVYQNQLAKRLLLTKSISLDDEREVINKIKQTQRLSQIKSCGSITTKSLEGMVADFSQSKEIEDLYLQRCDKIIGNIKVLNVSVWPKYKEFNDINLSPRFEALQNEYDEFYRSSKTGFNYRQLKWSNALSSMIIHFRSQAQDFECTLSNYQAQILFLFAYNNDFVSYSQIQERLGFDDLNMVKNLSILVTFKLLLKQTTQPKITPDESFQFNEKYSEKRRKIILPFVFAEEPFKRESMTSEREVCVEAAIVKIMKSRKQMPYQILIQDTMTELKTFKPTIMVIKQKIERLIQMDYLCRDQNNYNLINYVS